MKLYLVMKIKKDSRKAAGPLLSWDPQILCPGLDLNRTKDCLTKQKKKRASATQSVSQIDYLQIERLTDHTCLFFRFGMEKLAFGILISPEGREITISSN